MTSAEESKEKEEEEAFADVGTHRTSFKRKTLLDACFGSFCEVDIATVRLRAIEAIVLLPQLRIERAQTFKKGSVRQ